MPTPNQFPPAGPLNGTEVVGVQQLGVTKQTTISAIGALIGQAIPNLLQQIGPFVSLPPAQNFTGYVAITTDQGLVGSDGTNWLPIATPGGVAMLPGPAIPFASLPPPSNTPNVYAATPDQGPEYSDGTAWNQIALTKNLGVVSGIFTSTSLPDPSLFPSKVALTSDLGPFYSNGANWLPLYNPTNATIGITNNSPLVPAQTGVAYTVPFTATQSTGTGTWTVVSKYGSANNPIFSGNVLNFTPTAVGTDTYTIQFNDPSGAVVQKTFSIVIQSGTVTQTAAPSISPAAGNYTGPVTVTLTPNQSGSSMYYTTNGSAPTISSQLYTVPFTVAVGTTVKAAAIASGFALSNVVTSVYTITTAAPVYRFRPGWGMQSSHVDDVRKTGGTGNLAEMNLMKASGPTPGILNRYRPLYTIANLLRGANGLGTIQGDYSAAQSDMETDYNNLQATNPGFIYEPCIQGDQAVNWTNYTGSGAHQLSGNIGPVPAYMLNCGGSINVNNKFDGTGGTTNFTLPVQANGQCGFAYSAWNGVSEYVFATAAIWEPAVVQDRKNFWTWFFTSFTLPYTDGKRYTIGTHPNVAKIQLGDETSYSFGGAGPANYAGSGIHAATNVNFWTAYAAQKTLLGTLSSTTPVGLNITSGIAPGTDGNGDTNTAFNTNTGLLAKASTILGGNPGFPYMPGAVLSPSDTWGSHPTSHFNQNLGPQMQNCTQAHFGVQVTTSNVGSVPMPTPTNPNTTLQWSVESGWQNPDYNGGNQATAHRFYAEATLSPAAIANTSEAVTQLIQAAGGPPPSGASLPSVFTGGLRAAWITLCPCSIFAPGGGAGFNNADYGNYIYPTIAAAVAGGLHLVAQRPLNLMSGITVNSVSKTGANQLTVSWTPIPTDANEVGLGYAIFRNGVQVTSSITGTFVDNGLSSGNYTYTIAMTNGSGTGPQGPGVVGTV